MLPLSQKTLELLLVRAGKIGIRIEPPLLLPALLLQHVVVAGAPALEPALLAHLEAPGSTLVGLHFRHVSSAFRLLYPPAKRLAAREKEPFRLCLSPGYCIKLLLICEPPSPCVRPTGKSPPGRTPFS